jgi:hypothetical protein
MEKTVRAATEDSGGQIQMQEQGFVEPGFWSKIVLKGIEIFFSKRFFVIMCLKNTIYMKKSK